MFCSTSSQLIKQVITLVTSKRLFLTLRFLQFFAAIKSHTPTHGQHEMNDYQICNVYTVLFGQGLADHEQLWESEYKRLSKRLRIRWSVQIGRFGKSSWSQISLQKKPICTVSFELFRKIAVSAIFDYLMLL